MAENENGLKAQRDAERALGKRKAATRMVLGPEIDELHLVIQRDAPQESWQRAYRDVAEELIRITRDMKADHKTGALEAMCLHVRHRVANIVSAMNKVLYNNGNIEDVPYETKAPLEHEHGETITVRDLKDWLDGIPDKDHNGEDHEIWIDTGGGLSNPCVSIWPLNSRREFGHDVILAPLDVDKRGDKK